MFFVILISCLSSCNNISCFKWNSSHILPFLTTQQVSFILLSISIFFIATILIFIILNQIKRQIKMTTQTLINGYSVHPVVKIHDETVTQYIT
jgi:hypothetical protein